MSKYQKYVNAAFLGAGALVWLVSKHYIAALVGILQSKTSLAPVLKDSIIHGLPILLGALTFIILRSNVKSHNFTTDSVGELTKMTWPTPKETQLGTIVVVIAVVLSAIFFFAVDWGFHKIITILAGR
jgi:preprotein translocase SecE subunit